MSPCNSFIGIHLHNCKYLAVIQQERTHIVFTTRNDDRTQVSMVMLREILYSQMSPCNCQRLHGQIPLYRESQDGIQVCTCEISLNYPPREYPHCFYYH